jgi:transcriptional regulator with XRE-family HTH domain
MEKRIIELMEHYGLSSAQFADKIGVQRSSISHILSGRNKPSYDFLQKITTVFTNIDANWLINGTGPIEKRLEKQFSSAIEQDLFSQPIRNKEPIEKAAEKQTTNSNFKIDNQPINDYINRENTTKNIEFTNVNQVKQIILIYENNTFEIVNKK